MFKIEFETDGAAFGEEDYTKVQETVRILRQIADAMDEGGRYRGAVRDINGNTVGCWGFGAPEGVDSAGPSKTASGSVKLEG